MGAVMPGQPVGEISKDKSDNIGAGKEVGIFQAERYSTIVTKNKERSILRDSYILAN